MGDDRKKSWREIDRARESGSGRPRQDPAEAKKERATKTAAYSSYKSNLDKLFKPGGAALPNSLRDKLGPPSESAQARRRLTDELNDDPGESSLRAYLDADLELPPEPRLLLRLMEVRDEQLLRSVLVALRAAISDGAKVNRMLLQQRLQATEDFVEEPETRSLIDALRAASD